VSWSRLAGLTGFIGLMLWSLWSAGDGHLVTFWDLPSYVIVIGCTAALLLATFGWASTCRAIAALMVPRITSPDQADAVSFFRLGAVFALASGFVGVLIGLVAMLKSMEDPSQIGSGMAIALLTQLYGAILAVLLYVAGAVIARREATGETLSAMARRAVPVAGILAVIGVLGSTLTFMILLVSMANFDA